MNWALVGVEVKLVALVAKVMVKVDDGIAAQAMSQKAESLTETGA